MKTNILFLFALLNLSFLMSQNKAEERLLLQFSETELSELKVSNPNEYNYRLFYVENSFFISDIPLKKDLKFEGTIKVSNVDAFNIYEYEAYQHPTETKYYKIKGTNQMVCIRSKAEIAKIYKMHQNNQIKH